MSRVGYEGVAVMYYLVMALFGVGLVLASLWVFCTLSAADVGGCVLQAVNPFTGPP